MRKRPLLTPVLYPRTTALLPGTLLLRYNRFMADVRLDTGEEVVCHCVNTGVMEGLVAPGTRVWISRASNPDRKLKFTWELAEVDGLVYGVNTGEPNRLVRRFLEDRALPWLADWDELRQEVPYGEGRRVDFVLRFGKRLHYLEVKNVHLLYPDRRAYFPDSVSERAAHHLRELSALVRPRHFSAEALFVVQIPGAKAVRPSALHDPVFAEAAREAKAAGVRFRAIGVRQTPDATLLETELPVDLKPYRTERHARWREANRVRGASGWKRK